MKTSFLKIKTIALFVMGLGILATSCTKDDQTTSSALNSQVEDEMYTSEVYDEIDDLGDEALDLAESNEITLKSASGFGYNRLSECVTVTKVISNDTVLTTIDFGEINCECNDGRMRRGKILMAHYGRYWDGAVSIRFSFENFYVDDNQILGERVVSQVMNTEVNHQSTISANGSVVLADGSGTITWEAQRVRTIIEGSATRTKRDDVIEVTGGSTCTLADGTIITTAIVTPLVRKNETGCFLYYVQGIRQTNIGDETQMTIDFGDGECDNLAELTVNGETTIIELKRKRPNLL